MNEPGGNVKKYIKNKGHESLNRNMLQDVENLSPEAIGLLANLTSYPDNWTLRKTELYKRFKKAGKSKIQRIWDELVDEKYIVQMIRRNGKTYEYIYYHSQVRFSDDDIEEIVKFEQADLWDGSILKKKEPITQKDNEVVNEKPHDSNDAWGAENQQPKMSSSNRASIRSTTDEIYQEDSTDKNIDTYKDTDNDDFPNQTDEELSRKKKQAQDKILKDSLKDDWVPPLTHSTLTAFSNDYDEMSKWVGIIFRAKSKVEKKFVVLIELEEIDSELNKMLISAIRAIKKGKTEITVPDNYLFATIYNGLEKLEINKNKDEW